MKVAHLTTVDLSLKYLVFPQLEAVRDEGWQSVGISAPGPWVDEIEAAGIRHVSLPSSTRGMSLLADAKAARELWQILRRERLDVLHTHNPKPGLYGRVLGRLAGVPIVVNTVHGLYATPTDPLVKRLVVYGLEGVAARFSDAELVQSVEDLELLNRLRIVGRRKGTHLGNGVDLERFNPKRFDITNRMAIRQHLGIDPEQIVVGMVGRLVAEKGYPELFEAAGQLGDEYTVLCIGPDQQDKSDALPAELLRRAEKAGVRFLGHRTDVDALYSIMDLFVLPSHREGFPRSAMEASAMGLPVVATDIRGCREVVDDGVTGLLIPRQDPTALADAIRTIGEDPQTREGMGLAGLERAARFDERTIVQTVMNTYRRVAAGKGLSLFVASTDDIELRPAVAEDAAALARLHMDGIATGFLPTLGHRFMRQLYRGMINYDGAVVLVADDGFGPVGFVAGTVDTGQFYRYFLRRYAIRAGLATLPHVLRRPSSLGRVWESLRYGGGAADHGTRSELLATALRSQARGLGLGTKLGVEFLEQLHAKGAHSVLVVVGQDNLGAISAYHKMGFVDAGSVEVHAQEKSALLLWTP